MVFDNVFFDGSKFNIAGSIVEGGCRVMESVPWLMRCFIVPVVQKIVVEKGTADQRFFINPYVEESGNFKTEKGNVPAVGEHRSGTMLNEFLVFNNPGGKVQRCLNHYQLPEKCSIN